MFYLLGLFGSVKFAGWKEMSDVPNTITSDKATPKNPDQGKIKPKASPKK